MIYALNVFNFQPGKERQYRDYSIAAGKIIYGLGARVVASGEKPVRHMHGDRLRQVFVVVEFPSEAAFQQMHDEMEKTGLHAMREGATTDYIWTLYQPWDLRAWVKMFAD
jgi:uncharacterized protein (DUF1330 family)